MSFYCRGAVRRLWLQSRQKTAIRSTQGISEEPGQMVRNQICCAAGLPDRFMWHERDRQEDFKVT